MKGRDIRSIRPGVAMVLLLFVAGCGAAYSLYMGGGPLRKLSQRNYAAALASLEKPQGRAQMVLYRLERGLILHYDAQYQASNYEFEQAERLIDDLYTRSATREVASLLTNDTIRAYRGEEFEQVLIHYYRALNYWFLAKPQEALVECRKANLKLAHYATLTPYELTYKNDAFMQYFTGMLYEAEGEWNDAYVSYHDAERGYQAYSTLLGSPVPQALGGDLARMATRLGYDSEVQNHRRRSQSVRAAAGIPPLGPLVVFAETGFVARKHQIEINVPILKEDDTGDVWLVSDRLAYRYRHPRAFSRATVKYWLRLALPEYRPVPSPVRGIRVSAGGESTTGVLVEDLSAIAQRTFADKEKQVIARAGARALAKYVAARGVRSAFDEDRDANEDKTWSDGLGRVLGALVNLFGAATEAADTRSWLSLPRGIYMARLNVEMGTVEVRVEFLDASGRPVETQLIPGIEVARNKPVFVNCRGYR